MKTNRDFYTFIAELVKRREGRNRSLEQYLTALLDLLRKHRHRSSISLDAFATSLDSAFDHTAEGSTPGSEADPAFESVDRLLLRQISDLHEMDARGSRGGMEYFGTSAPSGEWWCNHDPFTYVECGAEGAFGGWREGDESDRTYVPGPVAVTGPDGELQSADSRDIPDPIVEMSEVDWKNVVRFLECGQHYE